MNNKQNKVFRIKSLRYLRVLVKMTVMILSFIYFFINLIDTFLWKQYSYLDNESISDFFCFLCSGVQRCFIIARKILNNARNLENTVLLWVELMCLFYRFTHFPLHLYFTSSCTEVYFLAFKKAVIKVQSHYIYSLIRAAA